MADVDLPRLHVEESGPLTKDFLLSALRGSRRAIKLGIRVGAGRVAIVAPDPMTVSIHVRATVRRGTMGGRLEASTALPIRHGRIAAADFSRAVGELVDMFALKLR